MRAAIKAINEENVEALTTAIEKIDDIDAGVFHNFYSVSLFFVRNHSFISQLKKDRCHL